MEGSTEETGRRAHCILIWPFSFFDFFFGRVFSHVLSAASIRLDFSTLRHAGTRFVICAVVTPKPVF